MNMLIALDDVEDLGNRIYDSLSVDDLNILDNDLRSLGAEGWQLWCDSYEPIALEIIKQRGEPLAGYPTVERCRLKFFILGKLRRAAALLNTDFSSVERAADLPTLISAADRVVKFLETSAKDWQVVAAEG